MIRPSDAALAARAAVIILEDQLRRERLRLEIARKSLQAPASAEARIRSMIRQTQIEIGKAKLVSANLEMAAA